MKIKPGHIIDILLGHSIYSRDYSVIMVLLIMKDTKFELYVMFAVSIYV